MKTIEVKETKTMEKTIKINGMMPALRKPINVCVWRVPKVPSAEVGATKKASAGSAHAEISDAEPQESHRR